MGGDPGSFNSPVADEVQGFCTVFLEMLDALGDVAEPQTAQQCDDRIPECRQSLWCRTTAHPTRILLKCYVPNAVKTVLDSPVSARQGQELLRAAPFSRQAGDRIDGLLAVPRPRDPLAANATDLSQPRPVQIPSKAFGTLQASYLNTTVTAVAFLGMVNLTLPRALFRGGKWAA